MALNQTYPKFRLGDCVHAVRPLPKEATLKTIPFRRVGDLEEVILLMKQGHNLRIDAAPGAGKTTRLPIELARSTGQLVVLVLPYEQLACVTADYLASKNAGDVVFLQDLEDTIPKSGLVVTYAGWISAYWLSNGKVDFPECYMLHDEAHESGAATAMMRRLAPTIKNLRSYAMMSATFSPLGSKPMEADGSVQECLYMADSFKDPWSVEEDDAPWAISAMEGHTLLIEDDDVRAAELMQAYKLGNVNCYRWHSRMSTAALRADLKVLNKSSGRNMVIVADSTFRSGYTLPVGTIIDSGFVRRCVVDEHGRAILRSRDIFEIEAVQTRCRGGRLAGLSSVYWRPKKELRKVICDMEQTDVEAFVYMCRLLNYTLDDAGFDAKLKIGSIPKNVFSSLTGEEPLAAIPPSHCASISDVRATEKKTVESDKKAKEAAKMTEDEDEFLEQFRQGMAGLRGMTEEVRQSTSQIGAYGKYLFSPDVCHADECSVSFPEGIESVKRKLSRREESWVVNTWSYDEKAVALSACLNAYNANIVQMKAISMVIAKVRTEKTPVDGAYVDRWAKTTAEEMTAKNSEAKLYYHYIKLIHSFGGFDVVAGGLDFSDETRDYSDRMWHDFRGGTSSRRIDKSKATLGVNKHLSTNIQKSKKALTYANYNDLSKRDKFDMWVVGLKPIEYERHPERYNLGKHRKSVSSTSSVRSLLNL